MTLTQQISTSPPEQVQKEISQPLPHQEPPVFNFSVLSLLLLISLLFILVTVFGLRSVSLVIHQPRPVVLNSVFVPIPSSDVLQVPGSIGRKSFSVPGGRYLVYEQQNPSDLQNPSDAQYQMYYASTTDNVPHLIRTPGYIYTRSVQPLITPDGQLLYSGDGLWLANIFSGTAHQIAKMPADQVVTSLILSNDGTTVAWSTEPVANAGNFTIYAGPLAQSTVVYQHSAAACPCFRAFSFMNGKPGNATLLLTDDRGDHQAVQYGLWSLDLVHPSSAQPQQLMSDIQPAGPLALTSNDTFLYSSYEGFVPVSSDGSMPDDASTLTYANSLLVKNLTNSPSTDDNAQVILPEQFDLSNSALYHWVTTPRFSADGHTLFYIEFSSDTQDAYSRRSTLYSVQLSGSGSQLQADKPQLVATTSAHTIELGAWLDPDVLTFYADGTLYGVDLQDNTVTALAQTVTYARIVDVVKH